MRSNFWSVLLLLCVACGNEATSETAKTENAAAVGTTTAEQDRDKWQKPEEVIAFMGGDLKGMTIADLFADDGYFTFKLIAAGANVIAVVNDPIKAAGLETRKKDLGLGDDRLRIRTVAEGDPGIKDAEVDMALIFHHFVLIQDKNAYFEAMRAGMRDPRPLVMVEWQYEEGGQGPPLSERMSSESIMDFVGTTGYSDVGAHSAKIPGQVIYLINDYMDLPSEGSPAP